MNPGIVVVSVLLLIFIIIYNILKVSENKVKQVEASIDVYLNKRYDLIPNLVECVKGYANYEEKVLLEITKERSKFKEEKSQESKEKLDGYLNNLIAVGESNPNLKASKQFLSLQKTIEKMESEIQAARRLYNIDVTSYNTKIQIFPINVFARLLGFKKKELFNVEEEKKENINVNF